MARMRIQPPRLDKEQIDNIPIRLNANVVAIRFINTFQNKAWKGMDPAVPVVSYPAVAVASRNAAARLGR